MSVINITILNVTKVPSMTKTGKPYESLDIAFKNNTYQGKVEGRKLMPFGDNSTAFNILKSANSGDTFNVTVEKNSAGYNDWLKATPENYVPQDYAIDETKAATVGVYQPIAKQAAAAPARVNTFETPDERAKKQLSITRLATLNTAVAALTPGSKAPLKTGEVLALAKEFENYVYDIPAPSIDATGFDDMDSDVPL